MWFSIFTLVSCASFEGSRDVASQGPIEKLSCLSGLKSFDQAAKPELNSLSSVQIEAMLEDSQYKEVYSAFNHPVEKERAAEIMHYIQKEYAEDSVEKQKSHFWDLFSCNI